MANIKNFKLLRNQSALTSRAAAVSALEALSLPTEEGTLVLARYTESGTPSSVLGIVNLDGSVTVLDLTGDIQDALNTLDSTLTLSGSSATDAHFTQVAIVDGKLNPTTSTGSNIDLAHLVDIVPSNDADAFLSANDTIHGALTKIEAAILNMDKAASAEAGKVVTTVSEANGVVSETKANVKDLQLGGYSKDAAAALPLGANDTLNAALSKLENGIAAAAEAAAVDGVTIVKDATSNKLKTAVKVAYVPASGSTAASIQLQDKDGNMLSSVSVADIVGNSVLKSSSYNPATGILTLTFASATGTDVTHEINLGELFDFEDIIIKSDSTNYLGFEKVTPAPGTDAGQAQLSAKIVNLEDATTSNTGLTDAKDVKDYVDNIADDKIENINVNGVAGTVTNHIASVTVEADDVDISSNYTKPDTATPIAAGDSVEEAIAKLEKGIENAVAGGLQQVNAGNGISVTSVANNQQTVSAVAAASNGTAVDGSTLVNPISVTANGIVFAETLDAGYYAIS